MYVRAVQHRVVHVPGCLDHIHFGSLLFMAHCPLCSQLHVRHGLDHRPPLSFTCYLSLKKGTPFADESVTTRELIIG